MGSDLSYKKPRLNFQYFMVSLNTPNTSGNKIQNRAEVAQEHLWVSSLDNHWSIQIKFL